MFGLKLLLTRSTNYLSPKTGLCVSALPHPLNQEHSVLVEITLRMAARANDLHVPVTQLSLLCIKYFCKLSSSRPLNSFRFSVITPTLCLDRSVSLVVSYFHVCLICVAMFFYKAAVFYKPWFVINSPTLTL